MKNSHDKESEATEAKKLALHYLNTVADVAREPFLILNSNLRVISGNKIFYETFLVSQKQTEGTLLYELGNGQWDIPGLKKLMNEILPEKKVVRDYEVDHVFETIGKKIIMLNARQIDNVQLIFWPWKILLPARILREYGPNIPKSWR